MTVVEGWWSLFLTEPGDARELEDLLEGRVVDCDSQEGMRPLFLRYRLGFDNSTATHARLVNCLQQHRSNSAQEAIEAALMSVLLEDERLAQAHMAKAKELLGFDYELNGYMGRRSRRQSKDCAILAVQVTRSSSSSYEHRNDAPGPVSVLLGDEDFHEEPVLPSYHAPQVGDEECCLLLVNAHCIDNFETRDDASFEKIAALLRCVLLCARNETVRYMALFLRSVNELGRPLYRKRAAEQLRVLWEYRLTDRKFFFCLALPSKRQLAMVAGKALAAVGEFRSAVDCFLSSGQDEAAAQCYIQLHDRQKAIELLEREQQQQGSVSALCLLGELKNDPGLFEQALVRSNDTCVPALRALSRHHISVGDYARALSRHNALIRLEPNVADNWFTLGCLQMALKQPEPASASFRHAVRIDPDHGLAWNNLAASLLQQDRFREALAAVKMASRLQWEESRVWESVFKLAWALRELLDAVGAYERLLEMQGSNAGLFRLKLLLELAVTADDRGEKQVGRILSLCDDRFAESEEYEAIKQTPNTPTVTSGMTDVLARLEHYECVRMNHAC